MGTAYGRVSGYTIKDAKGSVVPVIVMFDSSDSGEFLALKAEGITIHVNYNEVLPIVEEARNHEEGK
jgi:hypothetical protein